MQICHKVRDVRMTNLVTQCAVHEEGNEEDLQSSHNAAACPDCADHSARPVAQHSWLVSVGSVGHSVDVVVY
jgi:hypothetical protein